MKQRAPARYRSIGYKQAEERLNSLYSIHSVEYLGSSTKNKPNLRRTIELSIEKKSKIEYHPVTIDEPYSDGEPPVKSQDSPLNDFTNSSTETNNGEDPYQKHFSTSPDISPPPAKKIRRMQVGVGNSTPTTTSSVGKSVAERLKEKRKDANTTASTLTDQENCTNGNSKDHVSPSCSTTINVSKTTVPDLGKPRRPLPELNERQKNTLRVINQYLRELGMYDTVEALVDESGCREEDPLAVRLHASIKSRDWYDALRIIDNFKDKVNPKDFILIKVALLEELMKQYFIEKDYESIILCLQLHYPRSKEFADRRKYFSTLLADDPNDVAAFFKKEEKRELQQVSNLIEALLPSNFLISARRLDQLLDQSIESQIRKCSLHVDEQKKEDEPAYILKDHQCPKSNFPNRTTQVIKDHDTEVWIVKFSPCGKYLASGGKSGLVYIWKVKSPQRLAFHNRFLINDEVEGITSLAWSSDSKHIICGTSEHKNLGVYLLDALKPYKESRHLDEPLRVCRDKFTVADFFPGPNYRVVCADLRGNFSMFHYDGENFIETNDFEGFRIRSLVCLKDGKTVLAADTQNRIRSYDFDQKTDETLIIEEHGIVSFTIDREEKKCAIVTKSNGIRLWCLQTRTLLQTFFGGVHSETVITGSFGGINEDFFAVGSEKNNRVLIWKTTDKKPIRFLDGHSEQVNSVAWNPKFGNMLVSGSDDHTIRVWSTSPANFNKAEKSKKKLKKDDVLKKKKGKKHKKGKKAQKIENGKEEKTNENLQKNSKSAENSEPPTL